MTTSTLIRRVLVGAAGVVFTTSGLAFAGVGVPLLPEQADEQAALATSSASSVDDGGVTEHGPEDTPPLVAQENQAAAEARQRAARSFAGEIRAWTQCIQANAQPDSEEEAAARDDSFDPKLGCDAPAMTPGGEAFDPYAPDDRETESGPPEWVGGGPPEGIGPPAGVGGGPPEGIGPPEAGDDE